MEEHDPHGVKFGQHLLESIRLKEMYKERGILPEQRPFWHQRLPLPWSIAMHEERWSDAIHMFDATRARTKEASDRETTLLSHFFPPRFRTANLSHYFAHRAYAHAKLGQWDAANDDVHKVSSDAERDWRNFPELYGSAITQYASHTAQESAQTSLPTLVRYAAFGLAGKELDELLAANPNDAEAHIVRAMVGSYEDQSDDYQLSLHDRAVRAAPHLAVPYLIRAVYHYDREQYNEALQDAMKAIELEPTRRAHALHAIILHKLYSL